MTNNDLSQFSDAELQQELEKRLQRPKPVEVNAEEAIATMKQKLDNMIDTANHCGFWDEGNNECLSKIYCETFYGKDFWKWHINVGE